MLIIGRITNALMNKVIHLLISEWFDVIIFGIDALCQKANTSHHCITKYLGGLNPNLKILLYTHVLVVQI